MGDGRVPVDLPVPDHPDVGALRADEGELELSVWTSTLTEQLLSSADAAITGLAVLVARCSFAPCC